MGVLAINYSALSDAIKNAENAAKKQKIMRKSLIKRSVKDLGS